MRCLFCNNISDSSKSIEHIIPESLGNKEHILPKGFVCDSCNQYFASKIEKRLLEQPYFINIRHRMLIESKKGIIPPQDGYILTPQKAKANIEFIRNFGAIINIHDDVSISQIIDNKKGEMVIPFIDQPEENNKILSRFLAKLALEALLYKLIDVYGWIDEVMNKTELEEIKKYARYGSVKILWPYHQRRIYSEKSKFNDIKLDISGYNILHEFHFLFTKEKHFYFICAIFGVEYAINMGGPSIDSYIQWLKENDNKSILNNPNEIAIL